MKLKKYWNDRAIEDSSAQSTTQDIYLREIEFNVLSNRIHKYAPDKIADVGCGDGRTTLRLAGQFPHMSFIGFDYSPSMIHNANNIHDSKLSDNINFQQMDICEGLNDSFNLIYTTRCLINLPSWSLQKRAIQNIYKALTRGGIYLLVENFIEGHANFNEVRKQFGLSEIPVRAHNHFFKRHRLLNFISDYFSIEEDVNISSTYYLVSRIIYSKICSETGNLPDYFDDHHRFASGLPFSGDYGPVRLICLKK